MSPPRFRSFSGTTVPSLNYLFDARTARSEKPAHGWIQAEAGLLLALCSKNNPAVRSHVFTFDRPAYAGYDHWGDLLLHNEDNEFDERISPVLNLRESNPLDHPRGREHVAPENLLRRHALEKHPDPERNHHVAP